MKRYQLMGISIVIGAILAVSSMNNQEAYATDVDEIMSKMTKIDERLSNLKNIDKGINTSTLGKVSFEVSQAKTLLLEVNELNDKKGDRVNKIYEYLNNEFNTIIQKYQKDIKEYQKDNGLTIQEKKLAEKDQ